jgi:hypothetical protein
MTTLCLLAQRPADPSRATQATASQGPQSLAEMEAAGVRLTFVTSVKPNMADSPANSRFPLGPGDAYVPGSLFSATNQPLIAYLRFAYKFGQNDLLGLPTLGVR